jgi:hypothetical protein
MYRLAYIPSIYIHTNMLEDTYQKEHIDHITPAAQRRQGRTLAGRIGRRRCQQCRQTLGERMSNQRPSGALGGWDVGVGDF